tara:strand:+ start:262 stop:510 length:249 start_codon:yes stop_codon:yes gene_type:complete
MEYITFFGPFVIIPILIYLVDGIYEHNIKRGIRQIIAFLIFGALSFFALSFFGLKFVYSVPILLMALTIIVSMKNPSKRKNP